MGVELAMFNKDRQMFGRKNGDRIGAKERLKWSMKNHCRYLPTYIRT
jgi:hypothetical protein